MNETLISKALYSYLTRQFQTDSKERRFFRLDGFSDAIYNGLLDLINDSGNKLANCPLEVRTTIPLLGYEQYAITADRSATWYRNHVQDGHALILIFNRRTSDAQSLKNIFSVTESRLAEEGLDQLIEIAFQDYQPSAPDVQCIKDFLKRFRRVLFEPQLRDLFEYLVALNKLLTNNSSLPGKAITSVNSIEEAIVQALPYLGLFRCHNLAKELRSDRADQLLRDLYRAAQLGNDYLDPRETEEFLSRLQNAEFEDENSFGGPSPQDKKILLENFLTKVITGRTERLRVLELDWQDAKQVLFKKSQQKRAEQLQPLAQDIEAKVAEFDPPEYLQEMLQELRNNRNPNDEDLERTVTDYQDILGKSLSNKLRLMVSTKTYTYSDFIAGLTSLAIELLDPLQTSLQPGTTLDVLFKGERGDKKQPNEEESIKAFQVLYGGIQTAFPAVIWHLNELWELATHSQDSSDEVEESSEREKIAKADLHFQVAVKNANGEVLKQADLNWQYRSDSPTAATLTNLLIENSRQNKQEAVSTQTAEKAHLIIPLYNNYIAKDDMEDLDLQRPRNSLGAWYSRPNDLRQVLHDQIKEHTTVENWAEIDRALRKLEQAWGHFVNTSVARGVLASDLDKLLASYVGLLSTAARCWKSGQEAARGYRVLTQAWIVGPPTFDEWAVVPFLHPLKLYWWRERTRRFNTFVSMLLDPDSPTTVVDSFYFRRQLKSMYGSAAFPSLLALPRSEGWPDYFLPVDEVDGYELYRKATGAGEIYGLDAEITHDTDSNAETQSAAEALVRVVQDYIETYPFIKDGGEIFLLQCRNGALPGLLVEKLIMLADRHQWPIQLSIVLHTTDRGAPLFRRINDWLKANEIWAERPEEAYFPRVTLKVMECDYETFFRKVRDTDIVILPDVLAEQGQQIIAKTPNRDAAYIDMHANEYLPIYRAQQEPFQQREYNRSILLNPAPYPPLVRYFYDIQWAAKENSIIDLQKIALFYKNFSLLKWDRILTKLHEAFNWVVCYDTSIDRFLLEATFPNKVQVIRYSLGLGTKRQHNLTVSSSNRTQDIVVLRLTTRLRDLLPNAPDSFRQEVSRRLVDEAKHISGDIVLRAAGPGAYLNELIGLVTAKHKTEQHFFETHHHSLTTWIYLDDFGHWFNGKYPDLLFVAIPQESNGELLLHLEIIETKCVGRDSFDTEAKDAQKQTVQGVNRLAQAWEPGAKHLDAEYWYDQLYRAVVGNIVVGNDQMPQWHAFRDHVLEGSFKLDVSGHSWVFCHDGSANLPAGQFHKNGLFKSTAPDAPDYPLSYLCWLLSTSVLKRNSLYLLFLFFLSSRPSSSNMQRKRNGGK